MKRSSLRRLAALLATMLAIAGTAGLSGCGGSGEAAPSSATPQREAAANTSADAGRATPAAGEKTVGAETVQVRGLIPVGIRRAGGGRFDYDYRLVLQNTGPAVGGRHGPGLPGRVSAVASRTRQVDASSNVLLMQSQHCLHSVSVRSS